MQIRVCTRSDLAINLKTFGFKCCQNFRQFNAKIKRKSDFLIKMIMYRYGA